MKSLPLLVCCFFTSFGLSSASLAEESNPDVYPFAGIDANAAAAAMKLPAGFSVTVGASEPEVTQPIAMALDHRGRLWIAEAFEYPIRGEGDKGRDRVLVFEDTDGNGSLDKRTVFFEGLNLVSGLEVGFGGVWVGAAPYFMFIPDRDGDDVPDGPPQILLDGWAYQDTHETLNTFIWGPDGWLYGCHGVFTHSRVGKPGTAENERLPINAGVWRYHPTKHQFEVFAHGSSNPWGVDFNDHGQAFITACVIPHLYHVIQGARYFRQAGQHFNRYTYDDIPTIAEHRHYVGENPFSGRTKSDSAGGGHAHAGAMIYLGGRWPKVYRNQLFMNNIHGQRLNVDMLTAAGSGYVGNRTPDFLLAQDVASQILNLRYGPDGNAWMIDWYDMQACHHVGVDVHDRSNGRIYKINYGAPVTPTGKPELASKSDLELAELSLDNNDWYVRHGRRMLQERSTSRQIEQNAIDRLVAIVTKNSDETRRLRAAWALHVTGQLSRQLIDRMLADPNPYVRGWAIQLAMEQCENRPAIELVGRFTAMAKSDDSPIVRLYLASAAQHVAPEQRWKLVSSLISHKEDEGDHNLPLMYWYAAEPLGDVDPQRAMQLAIDSCNSMPSICDFMLRRIASGDAGERMSLLVKGLGDASNPQLQLSFLRAIRVALRGQRQVAAPEQWNRVALAIAKSSDTDVKLEAIALGVTFGDAEARAAMRRRVADNQIAVETRLVALESLLNVKDVELVPVLVLLLNANAKLSQAAILGLAQYDDPSIGSAILAVYDKLPDPARRAALSTLSSRVGWTKELLGAIESKQIAASDLGADLVRQMQFHNDPQVESMLASVWGTVRQSPADKLATIQNYTQLINSTTHPKPDAVLGRSVYERTCMKCHMLFGSGNKIGPDLTGSNRANLDYLLSNIVDPSAVMAKEYRATMLLMDDGRVTTGLAKGEDGKSITLQTADALVVMPLDEVERRVEAETSMMPDDQLRQFSEHEVRSLVMYLQGKGP